MPSLPLPVGGSALTGGDVSVQDSTDVLAEFSTPQKLPSTAPVRDAFIAAWTAGFLAYQDIVVAAAGQVDPLLATDDYLKSFAEEHSVVPGTNESEASVRARLFQAPEIVTPQAIVDGVNNLLAPYTDKQCYFAELELDGLFIHDDTASVWDSFIGSDPSYPDRRYDSVSWLRPGGAVPSDGRPREFQLRIPDLGDNDSTISFVLNADPDGIFVGDGSDTGGAESDGSVALSVFQNPDTSDDIYAAIVGLVQNIKGQGISWSLIVDPTI